MTLDVFAEATTIVELPVSCHRCVVNVAVIVVCVQKRREANVGEAGGYYFLVQSAMAFNMKA